MRTNTTKQVELLAFERLSDWIIIRGASRTIYKRHKVGIDMALAVAFAVAGWTWAFYLNFTR